MTADHVHQVLQADAEAQREIEQARRESDTGLAEDRIQARALATSGEARARKVLLRFEEDRKQARDVEARSLEEAAHTRRAAAEAMVEKNWDRMIREVVEEFWPK